MRCRKGSPRSMRAARWSILNEPARRLLGLADRVPFPADLLPRDPSLRDALAGAFAGESSEPAEITLSGRTVMLTARPLRDGGALLAFFDLTKTPPTRSGAPRLRGQRLARTQDADHDHRRLRRDARARTSRPTEQRAPVRRARSAATRSGCSASWTICSISRASSRAAGCRSRSASTSRPWPTEIAAASSAQAAEREGGADARDRRTRRAR